MEPSERAVGDQISPVMSFCTLLRFWSGQRSHSAEFATLQCSRGNSALRNRRLCAVERCNVAAVSLRGRRSSLLYVEQKDLAQRLKVDRLLPSRAGRLVLQSHVTRQQCCVFSDCCTRSAVFCRYTQFSVFVASDRVLTQGHPRTKSEKLLQQEV